MSRLNANDLHAALCTIGMDFIEHRGLRTLVLASYFDAPEPADDVWFWVDICEDALGEELSFSGFTDADDLAENFCGPCFDLHAHYGHKKWLRCGLTDYFIQVEGLARGEATERAKAMISTGKLLLTPVYMAIERKCAVSRLRGRLDGLERRAQELVQAAAQLRGALADVIPTIA